MHYLDPYFLHVSSPGYEQVRQNNQRWAERKRMQRVSGKPVSYFYMLICKNAFTPEQQWQQSEVRQQQVPALLLYIEKYIGMSKIANVGINYQSLKKCSFFHLSYHSQLMLTTPRNAACFGSCSLTRLPFAGCLCLFIVHHLK
ncbi:hypothetical protein FVR03_05885 [Pontibacter qinzhouensis]|uniref:Uncharacterized protein n=1 Tax=Pontibacter qinzhouensis TaxID=2603253 RepID=A0A5C8KDW3_9BACT|nr:hypothetical protein [Pontibacter qinzhouensis]TXK49850.1 hypothetical protein FVR03_05885 [Pontibacter qinzhouensis]